MDVLQVVGLEAERMSIQRGGSSDPCVEMVEIAERFWGFTKRRSRDGHWMVHAPDGSLCGKVKNGAPKRQRGRFHMNLRRTLRAKGFEDPARRKR
jgi:hypothetical protein